jgi:hypothetical protein
VTDVGGYGGVEESGCGRGAKREDSKDEIRISSLHAAISRLDNTQEGRIIHEAPAHPYLDRSCDPGSRLSRAGADGPLLRSRTELIENGQIKDTRIELCNYLPDGQLQRSLLNDTGAPLPRGFLRRAIAEDEKKKVEEFLTGLRSLLDQYTLPSAGKILDFMTSATTIGPDANGLVEMTGHNVVTPGDTLSIWTNARTRKTQRVLVNGFYKGDIVTLTGTFNTLPSGLNYMAFAEVTVPAKQMTLQVQNFDYQRPN